MSGGITLNKFLNWLEKVMLPISMKISSNSVLQATKDSFILSIPFTVVGSFSGLIKMQLNFFVNGNLKNILTPIINVFSTIETISIGLIGIVIVMASAYYLSEKLERNTSSKSTSVLVSIIALVAYMATIPSTILDIESGNVVEGFAKNFLNYEGMFTGLIVGLITAFLYSKLIKSRLTINLPSSVPPGILNSFKSIIPIAIIVSFFAITKEILVIIGYSSLQELISKIIVAPLVNIGTGLPAIIIAILLMQILWFFGLHGFSIIWGLVSTIWLPVFINHINIYAQTGDFSAITEVAPNVITNIYTMIGGSGATLGLIAAIFLVSKKQSPERAVAKVALIPGLFNINEPIIFGLPIVLNPIMFIPFVFIPVINAIISYFMVAFKIVTPMVVLNSGIEPIFFNAWVLGAFRLSPVLLMLGLFILDIFLYMPFVKLIQKQNEKNLEAN